MVDPQVEAAILYLAKAINRLIDVADALSNEVYDTAAKPGRTGGPHAQSSELHAIAETVKSALDMMSKKP